MYAIIRTGGKQYKVASGDQIEIDRLHADQGETVTFPAVLVVDGEDIKATASDLDGFVVSGEVVSHGRGKKIRVVNYHAKTGWKKARGHRSELTRVKITGIG